MRRIACGGYHPARMPTEVQAVEPLPRATPRWLGPVIVLALGLALLAWTWGKWADVLIDFGGELYVAWRLREGDVLYRDLAYFTGPLSPYVNSLWFRCFGTSALTLVVANLALLALTTTLLYRLAAALANRFAATVACALFLALCALAVHQGAGNYNFVCPYSHEMTHATLLSFAALTALRRWLAGASVISAAMIGLCAGCVFLTKVEFTLALGSAVVIGVLSAPVAFTQRARALGTVCAAALVPVAIAFGLLAAAMPASDALHGVLGAWMYVADTRISGFPLYRAAMGLFPLQHHLIRIVLWSAGTLALLGGAALVALRWRAMAARVVAVALVAFLLFRAWSPDIALFAHQPAVDAFYPLTLYVSAIAFALWRRWLAAERKPLALAFAVFALLLLARIALNVRVQFYGFALAAPALALVALAVCAWIPERIERAHGNPRVFQAFACALLSLVIAGHWTLMQRGFAMRTSVLGSGSDELVGDPRAPFLAQALEQIEKHTSPAQSVLVLPEGAMLNYLARRRAPSRYFNFMPPEMAMFGERAVLASLAAKPPELVVLIHRDTIEYGLPYFGRDYARELLAWVKREYQPISLDSVVPGQKPLEPGTTFAVAVLKRRR